MDLIKSTTDPSRDDTEAQIQDPILNPDPSQSPIQNNTSDGNKVAFDIDEDSSVQNVAVDVEVSTRNYYFILSTDSSLFNI